MTTEAPPIVRSAKRLLVEIEKVACDFPRKHKYSLGQDLREAATAAVLLSQEAFRASRDVRRCAEKIGALSDRIDCLKLRLQVAYELQAFNSNGRFEEVSGIAYDLGRQCGAWRRSVNKHLMGQSPAASVPPERAPILSVAIAPEAKS